MKVASAVLLGVSMMGLAACGEEEKSSSTATGAGATSAAAPAAEATSAAPAATAVAAGPAPSDKDLCTAAEKANVAFKKSAMDLIQKTGGEIPPAQAGKMLTDLAAGLTEAAGSSTTKAAATVKVIATQMTTAAGAADPITAGDTPEATKTGKEFNAACKAAGVTTHF
ncbi:hypothetical protein MB27_11645 [Actinoplanes utahensis]|uniref:Lipoprotein n=1 Tax=Actinoplanes utahensis TaxID=1869 RepID=A0A0A6UMP2_ACTUT|nr:hypothetical protein MB27_11645 [Actinoplanes utahensis]